MGRVLQSETLTRSWREVDANGFDLIYNVSKQNGIITSLNCGGTKREGGGNVHFSWEKDVEQPTAAFNRCIVNEALQAHVKNEFADIVAEETEAS